MDFIVFTLCFPSLRKIVIKIGKKKKRKPPSSEEESDDDRPPRHTSKDIDSVRFITCTYTHKINTTNMQYNDSDLVECKYIDTKLGLSVGIELCFAVF